MRHPAKLSNILAITNETLYTARKASVFRIILVHFFPHLDRIWRDTEYLSAFSPNAGNCGMTPNTDTFHEVVVSDANLPWWPPPYIKTTRSNYSFPKVLMIKESYNLIGQEPQLTTTKGTNLRPYLAVMIISMQKI